MDLGLGGVVAAAVLALFAIPLLVGAVLVILVVANRAEPDPSGRRPAVVYSYATSFVTLFVTLFATFVIVARLASLIGPHHTSQLDISSVVFSSSGSGVGPQHPVGDAVAREVVIGALLAIVAGFVYLRHSGAADRATAGISPTDPAGRVRSSYLAAVSFVCVAIAVVSVVVAAYQVFRIIAPGVFNPSGSGSRLVALRILLPLLYLAVTSFALQRRHASQLPPESRPSFDRAPSPGHGTPQSPPPAPVVPTVATEAPAAAPPRKRAPAKRAPAKRAAAKRAPAKRTAAKRAAPPSG